MKSLLEEYGTSILYFMICSFCLSTWFLIHQSTKSLSSSINTKWDYLDNQRLSLENKPLLEIEEVILVPKNEDFNPRDSIKIAQDSHTLVDLTESVEIYFDRSEDKLIGAIDTNLLGARKVKYVLSCRGVKTIRNQIVIVKK